MQLTATRALKNRKCSVSVLFSLARRTAMKNRTPVTCDRCRAEGLAGLGSFSAMKPLLDFDPVPRRARHDGWTPRRQRAFIAALAETGSVRQAAEAINMTPEGAYYLRRQPRSDAFRAAWDAALDHGAEIVDGKALERSIHGVPVPIFQGGKQVGERRVFNERLTMFLLQHRKPEKYGHARKGDVSPEEADRAETVRAEIAAAAATWAERLSALYRGRVRMERQKRLAGDIVAADFYLRQLTHMEVLLELGRGAKFLLLIANDGQDEGPGISDEGQVYGTDTTQRLDALRREAWAKAGEPDRPILHQNRGPWPSGMVGGADVKERKALLKEAQARAAQAQKMLEEALADQVRALTGEDAPLETVIARTPDLIRGTRQSSSEDFEN
jgi:hypothetical protein